MEKDKKISGVGVAALILKDGKVLVGKRAEKNQRGAWGQPGGSLRFGETLEECARREAREEAGVEIKNITFAKTVDDIRKDAGKHYVGIFMLAELASGEPKIIPGEFDEWKWVSWDEIPAPRFSAFENLI